MQALAFIRPWIVSVIPLGHTFFFRHDTGIQSSVFFPPHWLPNKKSTDNLYMHIFSGHPTNMPEKITKVALPAQKQPILLWPSQVVWQSKALAVQDDIARLHEVKSRDVFAHLAQWWDVFGIYDKYGCMCFIIYDWMNYSGFVCVFVKLNLPKLPPNGFLHVFLCFQMFFFLGPKKPVPPWEVLQTSQALTGLSGDFFEHKRLTQQVQSKLSSQVSWAFQQAKQTPWRNSCFGDDELKILFRNWW